MTAAILLAAVAIASLVAATALAEMGRDYKWPLYVATAAWAVLLVLGIVAAS